MPHDAGRDDDLVRQVADGSEDALAALYDRHGDAVFAAACRLTRDRHMAEEVVQETFLALWNRAELFDPRSGSLAAWLYTIARNRTVDRLRAAGRRPRLVPFGSSRDDEPESVALERLVSSGSVLGADLGPSPEDAMDSLEIRTSIVEALSTMADEERTVIVLAYQDGLTQAEIAGKLGWPLGTVKTRTRRALFHLRAALSKELGQGSGIETVPVPAGER